MALNKKDYVCFNEIPIYFSRRDKKKIQRMAGPVEIISNVCPDYPNDGKKFTFMGELGSGISLTAKQHLEMVPYLLEHLKGLGFEIKWRILLADLPELTKEQEEFYLRVAGSKEEYLNRCLNSCKAIKNSTNGLCTPQTFLEFYGNFNLPYLRIQEEAASKILHQATTTDFSVKFSSFLASRMALSEKFRGKSLSIDEHKVAAAHGMSLYATHGTLLRRIYQNKNLIIVNHHTANLQNFFACHFVDGYDDLKNSPKFPVGILDSDLY